MSQDIDPKHWGRLRLPEELIDAAKAICKREGFNPQDAFHLFLYYTLHVAYPEWTTHATELHELNWLRAQLEEMGRIAP